MNNLDDHSVNNYASTKFPIMSIQSLNLLRHSDVTTPCTEFENEGIRSSQSELQCIRKKLIGKVELVLQKAIKRYCMNQWKQNIRGDKYLEKQLIKVITGLVRLSIIIQRKSTFIKHKSFLNLINMNKQVSSIKPQKQTNSLKPPEVKVQQKLTNTLIGQKHLNNMTKILQKQLNKQNLNNMSTAFFNICSFTKAPKQLIQRDLMLGKCILKLFKVHLIKYFNKLKLIQTNHNKIDSLIKSFQHISRNVKMSFILNSWNHLKSNWKNPCTSYPKDIQTKINSQALCEHELIPPLVGNYNLKPQFNNSEYKNQYSSSPYFYKPIDEESKRESPMLLQYYQSTYSRSLKQLKQDLLIQNYGDIQNQIHNFQPILVNTKIGSRQQSFQSHHLLQSKFIAKKSNSIISKNKNLQHSKSDKNILNKPPKTKTKTKTKTKIIKAYSPNMINVKQFQIVNQYYITNHQYIPTLKKEFHSPKLNYKVSLSPSSKQTIYPKKLRKFII